MNQEEEHALKTFETRVRQLLLKYRALQNEVNALQEKCEMRKAALEAARSETLRLQSAYDSLKTAKMLEVSTEDQKQARNRLNQLVRRVDKCIALLSTGE